MQSNEFDELYSQVSRLSKLLATAYRDVTGEDLDLEGVVRHYPLVALGVAAGAGALGGWWAARRFRKQLPPPAPRSQVEMTLESLRDFSSRWKAAGQRAPGQGSGMAWEYLEQLLKSFPDKTKEEGKPAKNWLDTVLEPKLKEGMDTFVSNLSRNKMGAYFRQQIQRLESGDDTRLEDPESP